MSATPYADLNVLAEDLRRQLQGKKFILLYAYNGIGKTRLSTTFKDFGKHTVTSQLATESGEALVTEGGRGFGDRNVPAPVSEVQKNGASEEIRTLDIHLGKVKTPFLILSHTSLNDS